MGRRRGRWCRCAAPRRLIQLGDTLPLPYARGWRKTMRHLGVAPGGDGGPVASAPGHRKQTALLRKLGLTARAELTKDEAADLLAAVLGDWR